MTGLDQGGVAEPPSPVVSVIIPAYNAGRCVEAAVRSAFAQEEPTLEVIVVDDASNDDTREVVGRMSASEPRLRLLALSQRTGPAGARNAAIAVARGDWVALLDADDIYRPGRLRSLLGEAQARGADFLADNLTLVDAGNGEHVGLAFDPSDMALKLPLRLEDLVARDMPRDLRFRSIGFCKPLIRRQFLVENNISYDTRAFVGQDFVLYFEAIRSGARFLLSEGAEYLFSVNGPTHSTGLTALHHIIATNGRLLCEHGCGEHGVRQLLERRHARLAYEIFKHYVRAGQVAKSLQALAKVPLSYTKDRFAAAALSRLRRRLALPHTSSAGLRRRAF